MAQCFPHIYFNQLINKLPPNTACLLLPRLNSIIKKPKHEVCFARTADEEINAKMLHIVSLNGIRYRI